MFATSDAEIHAVEIHLLTIWHEHTHTNTRSRLIPQIYYWHAGAFTSPHSLLVARHTGHVWIHKVMLVHMLPHLFTIYVSLTLKMHLLCNHVCSSVVPEDTKIRMVKKHKDL